MNFPELKVRQFDTCQYILDKVFYSNYYQIKGFKESEKKPIVLDLGAHLGFFGFAALALGAEKVYSLEIHPENFSSLINNFSYFGDRASFYNFGVYTENSVLTFAKTPEIKDGVYFDFSSLNLEPKEGEEVYNIPVFTLDFILKNIIKEDIDILKINIGYAELEILEQSKLIESKIQNICLESSESEDRIIELQKKMKEKGFINSLYKKNEEESKFMVLMSKGKLSDVFLV